ncbi:fimbrial protein [Citrobacter telavivensis]
MKNKLSSLVISGFFLTCSGMVHAENVDTASTLTINGTVKDDYSTCAVNMSESSVSIIETPDALIKQGDNATNPKVIHLSVDGKCSELVTEGKIAYKILGVADNADGTALANSLTDETAAKGVGIGIFNSDNKVVSVNTGLLIANEDTTFGLQLVQLNHQEAVAGNIYATASVQIERL